MERPVYFKTWSGYQLTMLVDKYFFCLTMNSPSFLRYSVRSNEPIVTAHHHLTFPCTRLCAANAFVVPAPQSCHELEYNWKRWGMEPELLLQWTGIFTILTGVWNHNIISKFSAVWAWRTWSSSFQPWNLAEINFSGLKSIIWNYAKGYSLSVSFKFWLN